MRYDLRFLLEAKEALRQLDKGICRRILRKLEWLAENAEIVKPKGLRGSLAGKAKLREGDFRIIYEIDHDNKVILIRFIGHRSEIYKGK